MTLPIERVRGITPFVYAADAGSFAAAAERLNLTGSAISKSVARLEARLGVLLFRRTTRRLTLTDAGRAYYETCTRVLMELAEAESVLAQEKLDPMGRLRIDLPASFGRLVAMPILLRFCQQYPNLRPHITFTDRFVDLIDEGIDIAVRIGGPSAWPSSIAHRYVGRERLVFCAAPSYLEHRGAPASIADLDQHDSIAYGGPNGTVSPWTFAMEDNTVERRVLTHRMVAGDAEAQLAAVVGGLGVAQLATWLARDALQSGQVMEVLGEHAIDGLPLYVIWPSARQLTPKVDAILRFLYDNLSVR
jgi:DNA-binding transcriptional LysR family regulator